MSLVVTDSTGTYLVLKLSSNLMVLWSFVMHMINGCLENSDLGKLRPQTRKTQTLGCLENSDPEKTQTLGCLENSDPEKTQTFGCLENSDLWVSWKLRPEK